MAENDWLDEEEVWAQLEQFQQNDGASDVIESVSANEFIHFDSSADKDGNGRKSKSPSTHSESQDTKKRIHISNPILCVLTASIVKPLSSTNTPHIPSSSSKYFDSHVITPFGSASPIDPSLPQIDVAAALSWILPGQPTHHRRDCAFVCNVWGLW